MFNKTEIYLSAAVGLIFAIITYVIVGILLSEDALLFALFAFLFTTAALYGYLLIHNKIMRKRYAEVEKHIITPVFYKANGNFSLGKKVVNGNNYFTEGGIVFASFDEKPYRLQELPLSNILKYEIDNIRLNIYTKDNQVFVITTPDAQGILNALREKGWLL